MKGLIVAGGLLLTLVGSYFGYQNFVAPVAGATFFIPQQGGTGTSTNPGANSILIGNSSGVYDVKTLTAGSNVTITNSGGTVTIDAAGGTGSVGNWFTPGTVYGSAGNSTSTLIGFTQGIAASSTSHFTGFDTKSATTSTFTSTASSTIGGVLNAVNGANIAALSNLTSNGFVKTGSGNGTLSIDTNTYLTTAVTSLATSFPLAVSAATGAVTLSWNGISTSSAISSGAAVLYATGVNTFASAPTTTVSCAGLASCSQFVTIGSSPITITGSGDGVGAWFTPATVFGSAGNSTSTLIGFTQGIAASSTSRFNTI